MQTISQNGINRFKEDVFRRLDFDESAYAALEEPVQEVEYKRKSFVLDVGERWEKLILVKHGILRMFYTDLEGREFNKAFFWERHCIWPVAPMDRNEGILFSIGTVEATTTYELPIWPVYDWLKSHGKWEEFALPFAERLVETKFQREHDFLLLSATERYKRFLERYEPIVSRIPDYHLASFLGITNVSLSRIKKQESL